MNKNIFPLVLVLLLTSFLIAHCQSSQPQKTKHPQESYKEKDRKNMERADRTVRPSDRLNDEEEDMGGGIDIFSLWETCLSPFTESKDKKRSQKEKTQ